MDNQGPLIVQADRTILLEVQHPRFREARDAIAPFAELVKSPEHFHFYRITSLSLWSAAAGGMTAEQMIAALQKYSRYALPVALCREIEETVGRYGKLRLIADGPQLLLEAQESLLLEEIARQEKIKQWLGERVGPARVRVPAAYRGVLKQALLHFGYPVDDRGGYVDGQPLSFALRSVTRQGKPLHVRDYQRQAAEAFYAAGSVQGGSGVVVLPCGAGKTIVGLVVMSYLQQSTLILTTSINAVKQWRRELLDKTTLSESQIAEYTGESKQVAPVTLATYQILTYRPERTGAFPHFALLDQHPWGLIIYDEVHLLPAPVFRITAEIQARRRLGLTATLVREDGREGDVFCLIGPKKFDVPWKDLEGRGWIAEAQCIEVRLPLPAELRMEYAVAEWRHKFRLASENPHKLDAIARLLDLFADESVLIIGQYLRQLRAIHQRFGFPMITGSTPTEEREKLYEDFRRGILQRLILSKVGNFAIDLPDASVLIQVSGTFGSRQEEAQRLGRILRPKADGRRARFVTLVTRDSREMDFAQHRQLFLTEQGYSYDIVDAEELAGARAPRRLEAAG
ncbi:MAG: helicase [Gemmataceae bacterium]